MSWNDYVNFMTNDNVCDTAFIVGLDGSVWAGTAGSIFGNYQVDVADENDADKTVKVDVDEKANFFNALGNDGVCSLKGGIRLGNEKYFGTNFDGERGTWYLKKANGGACVAKCAQCILIGTYNNTKQITSKGQVQNPADTNTVVENLQNMLKGAGF